VEHDGWNGSYSGEFKFLSSKGVKVSFFFFIFCSYFLLSCGRNRFH